MNFFSFRTSSHRWIFEIHLERICLQKRASEKSSMASRCGNSGNPTRREAKSNPVASKQGVHHVPIERGLQVDNLIVQCRVIEDRDRRWQRDRSWAWGKYGDVDCARN
ncbi:crooked neck protein [Striga asiatica]|uniref:Crooked neck protein n=1 Tax=Striga asiatica TaxID=4170 RepID=A0A5A7RBH7_STRAF|nr:crooked neck protein [Striga asiatica]